jgi:hypothetical protein
LLRTGGYDRAKGLPGEGLLKKEVGGHGLSVIRFKGTRFFYIPGQPGWHRGSNLSSLFIYEQGARGFIFYETMYDFKKINIPEGRAFYAG